MRIEGRIERVSSRGNIIARFDDQVSVGDVVKDNKNVKVGEVTWKFGPVDKPYLEIDTSRGMDRKRFLSDKKIYLEEKDE